MAEFGEQLKRAREAKGMTQQTLAEKVYVTRQTVSRWESGDRYPDLLTLKKLSSVLGVSTDTLLDDEEMPTLVEKTAIIEKPIVNNILVAVYAAIVLVFGIQAYNALGAFYAIDALTGGNYMAVFMAGCALVEALLFVFSFVNILRGTDTPKKTGIVISVFFLLELFQRVETIFNRSSIGVTIFAILCFVPYILGTVGGYLYFVSKRKLKVGKVFVYIAAGFEVFAMVMNIWVLSWSAPSFITLSLLLSDLLKLLICVAFVYAAHVLGTRRTMASIKTEK